MNVTNSIVDFFQGNPFNNPIGSLIEKSTDSKNGSENWTLFMEVCDVINSMEDGPRLAIRALKRRLTTELIKDPTVILYTLTLLETCVKNCGYRFHIVVCNRDFLQEFEKILLSNTNVQQNRQEIPIIVRNRVLYLIQTWYEFFKGQPDFKEIEFLYMYLLENGVQFPMTDITAMSPINTPKRSVSITKPVVSKPLDGDTSLIDPLSQIDITNDKYYGQMSPESPVTKPQPSISMSSEDIVNKLSKDLHKVQCNLDVMCELMNEYLPTEHIPDNVLSLMKNLFEVNSEMQKRLLQLINRWEETQLKESSILFDMLRINDEMNSALTQYGRYERTIAGAGNKTDANSDITSRISKSNVADVFAAQQEAQHFYDGISSASKSYKADQKANPHHSNETQSLIAMDNNHTGTANSSKGALSSQEFDQFLSEQANSAFSINSDNRDANNSRPDRQNLLATKPKKEKSELFDL